MSAIPGKAPAVKLPPNVETGRDLLLEQLARLLTIEEHLGRVILPHLAQQLQDGELAGLVREHREETIGHVERVKQAFDALGERPFGRPALGLQGLKTEREALSPDLAPALRPMLDCQAAMGTEHYEINAYEGAIRLAEALGEATVDELLKANLQEEVEALRKLAGQADRLARLSVESRTAR